MLQLHEYLIVKIDLEMRLDKGEMKTVQGFIWCNTNYCFKFLNFPRNG